MSACTIRHHNESTRSRCSNAECRELAASRAAAANGASAGFSGAPRARKMVMVLDAHGDPFYVDLNEPVITKKSVTPETLEAIGKNVRLEGCEFRPGVYDLDDVTIGAGCKVSRDASIRLSGNSVISKSTVWGRVTLDGESVSMENSYHQALTLDGKSEGIADHYADGYIIAEGSSAAVDVSSASFSAPRQSEVSPAAAAPRQKKSSGAGRRIAQSLLWTLTGRGPRSSRRRRRR